MALVNSFKPVSDESATKLNLGFMHGKVSLDSNQYYAQRTHQGKRCKGRIPMETFIEGKRLYNEKNLEKIMAV